MAALAAVPWIAKGIGIAKAVAASKAVSVGVKAVKGATAAKVVSDVAKGRSKAPALPPPKPVAPLPDEDETRRATRRLAAQRLGQIGSGRASTILDNGGKLGSGY